MFCNDDLYAERNGKMNICSCICESFYCTPETNATLQIDDTPIKLEKIN